MDYAKFNAELREHSIMEFTPPPHTTVVNSMNRHAVFRSLPYDIWMGMFARYGANCSLNSKIALEAWQLCCGMNQLLFAEPHSEACLLTRFHEAHAEARQSFLRDGLGARAAQIRHTTDQLYAAQLAARDLQPV